MLMLEKRPVVSVARDGEYKVCYTIRVTPQFSNDSTPGSFKINHSDTEIVA